MADDEDYVEGAGDDGDAEFDAAEEDQMDDIELEQEEADEEGVDEPADLPQGFSVKLKLPANKRRRIEVVPEKTGGGKNERQLDDASS